MRRESDGFPMARRIIVLVAALILVVVGVAALMNFGRTRPGGSPQNGDDKPDDLDLPISTVHGDGQVLVVLEVEVPEWTPDGDIVHLEFDGYQGTTGWGVPMEEVGPGVWAIAFKAPANQPLTYKYNRNNGGYSTDEEFTPDSPDARRTIEVARDELRVRNTVEAWRWLSQGPLGVVISDYVPEGLPEREEPFVVGIGLLDFYSGGFDAYVGPTMDRIAEAGFQYIGFAYTPSFITNGDPLTFTRAPINTYTTEQLEEAFGMARERGLKIMLSAGVETEPGNLLEIDAEMQGMHGDEWSRRLVAEWEEVMLETAFLAEEYGIEILVLSNQWPFSGSPTDDQRPMLNGFIRDAIRKVNNAYSGKLTTDYHDWSEGFDYYVELDWVGDKWWWGLTTESDPSLEELVVAAERIVDEMYWPLYEAYGKPIFLQQLAYASYDGAAGARQISTEGSEVAEWYPYNDEWPLDLQEQVDAYEACFRVIGDEEIFSGVFAFGYGYWDLHDKSSGVRGKPAEDVWIRWNEILVGD